MKTIEQALGGPRNLSVIFDDARTANNPMALTTLSTAVIRHIGYWRNKLNCFSCILLINLGAFGSRWARNLVR